MRGPSLLTPFAFALTSLLILVGSMAQATSFAPMSLEERVSSSGLIVTADIQKIECRGPAGEIIAPDKACTHPGSRNKIHYVLKIIDVLFQSEIKPSYKRDDLIEFSYHGMGHTTVPADNYAEEIKRKQIFFLQKDSNLVVEPLHEAFFREDLTEKSKVLKLIKKQSKNTGKKSKR